MQRLGALSIALAGLGDVAILLVYALVLSKAGLRGNDDVLDPARAAAFRPGLLMIAGITLAFGLLILPAAEGLRARIAGAPDLMRLATGAAAVAAALFLAAALVQLTAPASLAGDAAWRPVQVVVDGLEDGGIFAVGLVWIVAGVAGVRTAALPRALGWSMVVAGALGVLAWTNPLVPLVETVAYVVTTAWLAIVLGRG